MQLNFTFHIFQNCSRMTTLTFAAATVKITRSAAQWGWEQPNRAEYSTSLPASYGSGEKNRTFRKSFLV